MVDNFIASKALKDMSLSESETGTRLRRRFWSLISKFLPGLPIPVRLSGTPGRMLVRAGDEIGRQIFLTGRFDVATSCFMSRFLDPGMIFFDIGANIGHFTKLAAHRLGTDGQVWSFEPSPREYAILKANVSLNRFKNVRLFNSAVGSAVTRVTLKVFSAKYGAFNTLGTPSHSKVRDERYRVVDINCVTLDSVTRRLDFDHVDLMKIDVEGCEVEVLKGAGELMRMERSPVIICEVGDETLAGFDTNGETLRTTFQQFDYYLYGLSADGSLTGVAPEQQYYGSNYVALRKDHLARYFIAGGLQ